MILTGITVVRTCIWTSQYKNVTLNLFPTYIPKLWEFFSRMYTAEFSRPACGKDCAEWLVPALDDASSWRVEYDTKSLFCLSSPHSYTLFTTTTTTVAFFIVPSDQISLLLSAVFIFSLFLSSEFNSFWQENVCRKIVCVSQERCRIASLSSKYSRNLIIISINVLAVYANCRHSSCCSLRGYKTYGAPHSEPTDRPSSKLTQLSIRLPAARFTIAVVVPTSLWQIRPMLLLYLERIIEDCTIHCLRRRRRKWIIWSLVH